MSNSENKVNDSPPENLPTNKNDSKSKMPNLLSNSSKAKLIEHQKRKDLFLGFKMLYNNAYEINRNLSGWPTSIVGKIKLSTSLSSLGNILVAVRLSQFRGYQGKDIFTRTDSSGGFLISLPGNLRSLPPGKLIIEFIGKTGPGLNNNEKKIIKRIIQFRDFQDGFINEIELNQNEGPIFPIEQSILIRLIESLSNLKFDQTDQRTEPGYVPQISQGDSKGLISYKPATEIDIFNYSICIRLVEPFLYPSIEIIDNREFIHRRQPIQKPFDISSFRRQLIGTKKDSNVVDNIDKGDKINLGRTQEDDSYPIDPGEGVDTPETRLITCGTIGLGYVLNLSQTWNFDSLALGDLLYSLPLAPGEQRILGIFENSNTLEFSENEASSASENQSSRFRYDSSLKAVFDQAYDQTASSHSKFSGTSTTKSSSRSGGGGFFNNGFALGAAGGNSSGTTDTSGESTNTLKAAENFSRTASEALAKSVEQSASAFRQAQRAVVRNATETDSRRAEFRTVTNFNRIHALTIQYFEVLRIYNIKNTARSVTLACFIPMKIIQFLPPLQRQTLISPDQVISDSSITGRQKVMQRYSVLLSHAEILKQTLPFQYLSALNRLLQFASNPVAEVATQPNSIINTINIKISGNFVSTEEVMCTIFFSNGTTKSQISRNFSPPFNPIGRLGTYGEFSEMLREQRRAEKELSFQIQTPTTINIEDVIAVSLKIYRKSCHVTLNSPDDTLIKIVGGNAGSSGYFGVGGFWSHGIRFSAMDIFSYVGYPNLMSISVKDNLNNDYHTTINTPTEFTGDFLRIPITTPPPLLKFYEILEIEAVLQHIICNSVEYSKAVWLSLSQEELTILLEPYTIGIPKKFEGNQGGTENDDDFDDVPINNCVGTTILGTYGNSIVLPFQLPGNLARYFSTELGHQDEENSRTPGELNIEDALLQFHKSGQEFIKTKIALPTQGVLGETTLSHEPAAEKIDLTRFWNWKDSPIPATGNVFGPEFFKPGPMHNSGQESSTKPEIPSIINNVASVPSSDNSVLNDLMTNISQINPNLRTDTSQNLFNLLMETQKTAEGARSQMATLSKDIIKGILEALPKLMKKEKETKPDSGQDS